jgi:tetratricopeptide (TPR) repeat protein
MVHVARGVLALGVADFARALAEADRAGDVPAAHAVAAAALEQQGRLDEAARRGLASGWPRNELPAGLDFLRAGDAASAAAPLDRALARKETDEALLARAEAARQLGDGASAAKLVDRALALAPRSARAHAARVYLALFDGDAGAAVAHAREAVELEPSAGMRLLHARSLDLALELEAAEKAAGEAFDAAEKEKDHDTAYDALLLIASLGVTREDSSGVLNALSTAVKLAPRRPEAPARMADLPLLSQAELSPEQLSAVIGRSVEWARKARDADPSSALALRTLANAELSEARLAKATPSSDVLGLLDRARDLDPSDGETYIVRVRYWAAFHGDEAAEKARYVDQGLAIAAFGAELGALRDEDVPEPIRSALPAARARLDRAMGRAWFQRALRLRLDAEARRDPTELPTCVKALERRLVDRPLDVVSTLETALARAAQARAALRAGSDETGREMLDREVIPVLSSLHATCDAWTEPLIVRGFALLDLRRPPAALTDFERARALDDKDARTFLGLARARLAGGGDGEEALQDARRATELDPKLEDAWSTLARALRALGREDEAREAERREGAR